jgi:hypothetical protein
MSQTPDQVIANARAQLEALAVKIVKQLLIKADQPVTEQRSKAIAAHVTKEIMPFLHDTAAWIAKTKP